MFSFCCSGYTIVDTFDTPICQNSRCQPNQNKRRFFPPSSFHPSPATGSKPRKKAAAILCVSQSVSFARVHTLEAEAAAANQPTAKLSRSCSELAGSDFDGLGSGEKRRRKKFSVLKSAEPNWDRVFCVFWFSFGLVGVSVCTSGKFRVRLRPRKAGSGSLF